MSHQQPAAELIANALAKIKKLAGNKKHAELAQECQKLIDSIHEVLSPEYASRAAAAAAAATAAAAASSTASRPSVDAAADAQLAGQQQQQQQQAEDQPGSEVSSARQSETDGAAAGADAPGQQAAADNTGAETPTAAVSAAAATPKADAQAPPAAAAAVVAPAPAADLVRRTDSAISDAAALAVMQVLQLAAQTLRPNIVEVALDLIHKLIAFRYLQGAAHYVTGDSKQHEDDGLGGGGAGKHSHHQQQQQQGGGSSEAPSPASTAPSEAAGNSSSGVVGAAGGGGGGGGVTTTPGLHLISPQGLAVQIICSCDEIPDEGVEVLVLRGLLTATTSLTFTLHGQALLLAVRTCYNIHLMSRSEVNQTTAKATLTQMLNVVFQRMEAGSVKIAVKPIIVADLLSTAGGRSSMADISGMTAAVQGFLNNVVAAAGYGAAVETPEQLKQSVAAAIIGPRASMELQDGGGSGGSAGGGGSGGVSTAAAAAAAGGGGGGGAGGDGSAAAAVVVERMSSSDDDDDEDDKNTFQLAPATSSEVQPAAAAGGGAGGSTGTSAAAPSANGGAHPAAAAAAPNNLTSSSSRVDSQQLARLGSTGASAAAAAAAAAASHGRSLLLKDAFLVFRALCKLSIRTSDSVTVSDPTAVRGKLLALELLKVLLENSGPTFRCNERFTAAIRQYLCLSLLKNSASSIPAALQLSASIFLSLLQKFRSALKAEVGVFFPMIMLKVLEPPAGAGSAAGGAAAAAAAASLAVNSYSYKVVVLRCLREVCSDGQLLVDLFVNYDCDLGSSNLFERMVNGLVKMAQAALPVNADSQAVQQEQWLRQEALQCLSSAAEALLKWYRQMSDAGQQLGAAAAAAAAAALPAGSGGGADGDEDAVPRSPSAARFSNGAGRGGSSTSLGNTTNSTSADGRPSTSGDTVGAAAGPNTPKGGAGAAGAGGDAGGGGEVLSRKRAYKEKWQEGVGLFNKKPKKGIALLQTEDMLGRTPEDVATFLAKTEGLDKTLIGDYLGEREDFNLKVMHAFVDALDFSGLEFDTAIRTFLQGFRLPGEAQKIDRLMEKFAERYVSCNPGAFKSADVCYVLAYSVIMLNTDAHNPQVKKKMGVDDFLKNNRGINDGQDLPQEFMRSLYDRIVNNEIKMKDEALDGNKAAAEAAAQRGNMLMNALWSIVGGGRAAESNEPSDDAIKRTLDYLHDRAKGATYFTASDPDTVRPMLELIWAPLLGAFSLLFDEYSDPRLLAICLSGFEAATCLAAVLGVGQLRDVFVNSLCNFTHLHTPSTMKPKNGMAFKSLINVALSVGNHLGERWLEVLRCISRWELLQQIASGMPTDAVLFAAGSTAPGDKGGTGRAAAAALKEQLRRHITGGAGGGGVGAGGGVVMQGPPGATPTEASGMSVTSMESLAMSEASIKRSHHVMAGAASGRGGGGLVGGLGGLGGIGGIGGGGDDGGGDVVVPAAIVNSVDTAQLNKVYMASSGLDSDAIVAFVRCLVTISLDELRDAAAPRVFSLTKIVEISTFNMGRIRLVWSRIWAVLSQYFSAVGCHSNLAVAMYAVDSLRQLAMKFLEKDELSNYTFQNDFMRPFVVVMRQSQAVEIRELIIRCVSQMVLARVNNIKSGWQSMFMVFTTAAGDPDPNIVVLAFKTVERIVREHFGHITETETTTFMDCVNCLIAFTNNPHSLDVALSSIAFLRFCASRLAEGSIGELPEDVPAIGADMLGATRLVSVEQQQQLAAATTGSGRSSAELRLAAAGGGASTSSSQQQQQQPGALKFVDRDEHVYFWFPLLAGLSELTFDPRPEIRRSALEVLFDVLKCHGGSFAESFWSRIFDRVLLPIFDHVRAEVTDTTTFTSERRRQQEDAWLYETCTHCLQHLVDLFGQYYSLMRHLLSQLLLLLRSFVSRSHASLASVGVAAYARLVSSCGAQLDLEGWQEVVGMLQAVITETLPDAAELVTPPARPSSVGDSLNNATTTNTAAAAAGSGTQGLSQPRPPYTLREGVGMRRLLKFRVASSVQLLLVQAASEMYVQQYKYMGASCIVVVADCLQLVATHSRRVNTDPQLRRRLAQQQVEDRVPEDKQVLDPPLLRQETEASHAYLSMLLHLASSMEGGSSSSSCLQWAGATEAQQATQASQRLVQLAYAVLERFSQGTEPQPSSSSSDQQHQQQRAGGSSSLLTTSGSSGNWGSRAQAAGALVSLAPPGVVYTAFAPLVVSTLKALAALSEGTFRAELFRFFPLLTRLISCDHTTADVQRALSELFMCRIGPLLVVAENGGGAAAISSTTAAGGGFAAAGAAASVGVAPPPSPARDGVSFNHPAAMVADVPHAATVLSSAPAPPPAAAVFGDSLL